VADASTSGVAVAAQVVVGDAVGDTGTIIVGGCQVEAGTNRTSIIPTVAAAVTRNADQNPEFAGVSLAALASTGCSAISITPLATSNSGGLIVMNTSGRPMYANTTVRIFDGANEAVLAAGFTLGTTKRYRSTWSVADALDIFNVTDVTTAGAAFDGAMNTTGPLQVGASTAIGLTANWIVSRVQLDPNPSRCQ
jgi:hypothetical protein